MGGIPQKKKNKELNQYIFVFVHVVQRIRRLFTKQEIGGSNSPRNSFTKTLKVLGSIV